MNDRLACCVAMFSCLGSIAGFHRRTEESVVLEKGLCAAAAAVAASRTVLALALEITHRNATQGLHERRMPPDLAERLLPHVASRNGKRATGMHVPIGRDASHPSGNGAGCVVWRTREREWAAGRYPRDPLVGKQPGQIIHGRPLGKWLGASVSAGNEGRVHPEACSQSCRRLGHLCICLRRAAKKRGL